jgi:hypothetical protein
MKKGGIIGELMQRSDMIEIMNHIDYAVEICRPQWTYCL